MATTKFVAVNVTPEARDILRLLAVQVSAQVGRRVSMSDALIVANAIAGAHTDEIAARAAELLDRSEGEAES